MKNPIFQRNFDKKFTIKTVEKITEGFF